MFAARPKEKSCDGSSKTFSNRDNTKSASKVKIKAVPLAELTLPPLGSEPACLSSPTAARSLFSYSSIFKNAQRDKSVSMLELPHLIAQVGSKKAVEEAKWKEGLATALGTVIPIKPTQLRPESLSDRDESVNVPVCNGRKKTKNEKEAKLAKSHLTGIDIVQMFTQEREPGEVEWFYLKEVDGDAYRPYDLQVVHSSEAGSEHYIFSSNTVIHVTKSGFSGSVSLAEWCREYMLWTALQEIPFFKDFRVRKAFSRWHKNTRTILFQRKCKNLQDVLLVAVPQFRNALYLFIRVTEELIETCQEPLDVSKTYTLMEFKRMLLNKNEECLLKLEKLFQIHAVILNSVRDESYETHKELQKRLKIANRQPTGCSEPIHLLLALRHQLEKELFQSENILQKLGNFASLIHQMIIQSLVSVTQQDAVSFLSLLKRVMPQQHCLFYTELCLTANSQLTVDPPIHQFHETMRESLLTSGSTIIQMCENLGFFLEVSHSNHDSIITEEDRRLRSLCARDMLGHQLVEPEGSASVIVQSNRVQGCYPPLSRTQLEWHINISDVTKQAETQQMKIFQDTELEIQQVCESYAWLMDIHVFVGKWSLTSLESLKCQPASVYEEHVEKLRSWTQRINTVQSVICISNQLFTIDCSRTKETLRQQLCHIEEQVLEQLVELMKSNSERLVSDLETRTAELETEPQDVHDFSTYALRVRESVRMFSDMQKSLEYTLSLYDSICRTCRKMTEQELILKEKMLRLWDDFLHLLKQADNLVCHNLPSITDALNMKVSVLVCELKNIVSKATSGPFLDLSQNASQMVSEMNDMTVYMQTLTSKLEELNRSNQNLHDQPLDLTMLMRDIEKVTARKELWQIKAAFTTWLEEWKKLQLNEVVLSQAQEKIIKWKEQTQSLISFIPSSDPLLEETLQVLESLSHQVEVMMMLTSSKLKDKHTQIVFQGLGLLPVPGKTFTVAEVLSQQPETHQEVINRICNDAQTEWNLEQNFQKLFLGWKDKLYELAELPVPACQHCETQSGLTEGTYSDIQSTSRCSCIDPRFIIVGLETLFSEIDNDLISLSIMMKSPHSAEFRLQIDHWVQSLQELSKLLDVFERYQQTWVFLSKAFSETSFYNQEVDLWKQFQPVDDTFKELMHSISADLHVLNFVSTETVNRFHGDSLYNILLDGLSTMEIISKQMVDLMQTFCDQFPRLWFLSESELMELLSYHPPPFTLQTFLHKCFKGVRRLEVDIEMSNDKNNMENCRASSENYKQMKVQGFFGSLQEHIAFQPPLEPNPDTLVWLCVFEKQLKMTMTKLVKQCAVQRNQLEPPSQDGEIQPLSASTMEDPQPLLDLLSDFPLQCLLVVEKAVWCRSVLHAVQETTPVRLSEMKKHNSVQLNNLGDILRNMVTGSESKSLASRYTTTCMRALVQLTMNHRQQLMRLMEVPCDLEKSFEWLSLMKYHLISDQDLQDPGSPSCYVDILGHQFQYGFEYFGPKDLTMVDTPSTEKAVLGIVLALTRYRCGFVVGPSMSGKTNTVIQLGKALGQLYVVKQCYPCMTSGVVQRMLLGALQTGAWLLFESVNFLAPGVLSSLGQVLADVHQYFSTIQRHKNQRPNEVPGYRTAESVTVCRDIWDSEFHIVLLGKKISPSPSYGCVLISSKGQACKIPESLRFATRPIALTHPDYRIIAEVTLTSIGFSEATHLSHRLVSLIGLAKDSRCLTDFFPNEACHLVILQKIISVSEIYLEHDASQRETEAVAAEHSELLCLQSLSGKCFDDKKETAKLAKFCKSRLSVIQSLMEETAIIKAILSILMPLHIKTSQFYAIFKDTFPIVCQFPFFQQFIEEREKNQLQEAVIEELQQGRLCSDTEIMSQVLKLYWALKVSPAVVLIGPPGSGKSACYAALAGALNRLASKTDKTVFENEITVKNNLSHDDPQSASNPRSVDTLVLFPNAMSHNELFGCFSENGVWKDGTVAKVLRNLGRHCTITKWLVMDGEPVGQPSWFDYLTTLFDSQDSHLCLSSGETLLSNPHLSLLMELTDLQDASPSAVTRCSLLYFTGTDLWKAVWRSEIDSLSLELKLDQEVLTLWNRLADDLFSDTLNLLWKNHLTSANHFERGSCKNSGLQEILSFFRILRAHLQHFMMHLEKPKTISQAVKRGGNRSPGDNSQNEHDLLTRNLFLVAYIWGFGGHLHSRHWPQFDLLVRQVLLSSRFKILIPDEESVFEYFAGINNKMCSNDPHLTNSITPKFGAYRHLVNLMLEANQPVLIAGEAGSGKTTLCNFLPGFDRPHIKLPASPLLSSRDLRIIFNSICSMKQFKNNVSFGTKQSGLLLFLDDLHEAPRDVFGKVSSALETLRQSMSTGESMMFDALFFKSHSSQTVSYMATSCISALDDPHRNVIPLRLSRLFSIFVLHGLSMDVLLSIHSPWMKSWLKQMPLNHNVDKMSNLIITATKNLYESVCAQFQPTALRPQFLFSPHDIQKVFSGMYLWQHDISDAAFTQKNRNIPSLFFLPLSGLLATDLKIVHLWMHECLRTFSDRLCSKDERKTFLSLLVGTAVSHYGCNLVDERHTDISVGQQCDSINMLQEARVADRLDVADDQTLNESKNSCSEETSLKRQPALPLIFKHCEDMMSRLVYGPEISEVLESLNQGKRFKDRCFYQELDFDVVQEELCAFMDPKEEDEKSNYNNICNTVTRYSVHRQGVSQMLHIIRALLIPGGHGVLIGSGRGTGRKTAVHLAAHLTGCRLLEINSNNENKLHEILKEAGTQANVGRVNVIILVHEEVAPPVREELLVAMAQNIFPGLISEDQLGNLVSREIAVKRLRRYHLVRSINEKRLSQVHKNIHVFLLMPFIVSDDNKNTKSWHSQMLKALKLSCCVELYQPWSSQSLIEAASHCLNSCPVEMSTEVSKDSLSVVMAGIHQSACQYASDFLKSRPFSPRTYMEFIAHFCNLWKKLHKEWQNKHNRVSPALDRLTVLNNTVLQCQELLIKLQKKIEKKQQLENELIRAVEDQRNLFETASKKCEEEENKLNHLEEQINQTQELIKPVFLSRLKILQCLNPSDLEEVRHYRDPPDRVLKVIEAICLLFNHPPGRESAKQLLGQSNFCQEMEFFDYSSLTNEQLQQLGQIVHSPQFVPESVREGSKACESLCRWVQAVYEFCSVQHPLGVRHHLELQIREARSQLLLAKKYKNEARQLLEDAELQLEVTQNELEDLKLQLDKAETQEEEATPCASHLEMHIKNWSSAFQETELHRKNIPGDALILAAIISYLGLFGPDLRTELLSKWKQLCWTGSININPNDLRNSLFTQEGTESFSTSLCFPITTTERLQLPVGQTLGLKEWQLEDNLSARLMVQLLLWGYRGVCIQHWPLLADTELHLEMRSKNWLIAGEKVKLEEELAFRLVLCADDSDLLDKLDQAAEKGWRVLVTHLERVKPSPEFVAKLTRPSGYWFPGLQKSLQQVHPEFCLVLSTNLPVRLLSSGIHPSVLAQVLVVDLSLSSEEIQEMMLTQLLQSECRELLIQHKRFQNYNQFLQEKLVSEEDALIGYILQADTLLHKDSYFLARLAVCQEEMKKLQAEIKHLSEEQEHHESLLAAPRQLMKLAAALYQTLQAVAHLSPAYYFSLHDFIKVMQEVFSVKCRPLVSNTSGKAAESMVAEIMNMMVFQLLVQYRPHLYRRHFAVLKLFVSLAVLEHNQLCSEAEKLAFLRGLDIEHPVTDVKTCISSNNVSCSLSNLPSWVSPPVHSELLTLEKIPSFRGLMASLCTSPNHWEEYLQLNSSTVTGPVPCRSHSHLSLLQRALLWKTILPHSLEKVADALSACMLCLSEETAGSPYIGNLTALSRYLSKYQRPIILALPDPQEERQMSFQPLHSINQMAQCVEDRNQVQVKVLSFGEQYHTETIMSMLDKAISEGLWLVFNNCHLLERWDDNVVARLSQLISSFKEKSLIHPCFRLWFVTQGNAAQSLPAAVRMCALLVVCDPPLDLSEALSCSLQQIMFVSEHQLPSHVADDNMEFLVRCAIFHSVLQQRQTYKYLGSGRICHWSQEDLVALVDAHVKIASLCKDKANILKYIAVNLVHGGHVMDSTDLEVMESVARTCFATESPLSGSGPHILSEIISSCGPFDLTGILKILEKHFKDSGVTDPAMLGFSVGVASEVTTTNSHQLNLLLQASQTPPGAARSFSTKQNQLVKLTAYYSHTRERLKALRNYLAHKNNSAIRNVGAVSLCPLWEFFQAEWDDLIDLVSSLLSQFQHPVPYTSSLTSALSSTDLSQLETRAELISAYLWHDSTSDPPGAFRLSVFKNPKGFLVALMREAAQKNYKYTSDIILHFQVVGKNTYPASLPPDAVYICGLKLKGASWDTELGALQDTFSPQPCSMPLLCVKARVRSADSVTDALSCKSSDLMDSGDLEAAGVPAQTDSQLPVYHCPLYVDEEQEGGNSGLNDVNIITKVPLHAKLHPVLCSLRGVRLVSTL